MRRSAIASSFGGTPGTREAPGTSRPPGWTVSLASRTSRMAFAGLLGVLIVGCGGESDRATSTTDAATTATPTDVERYLLQADEVPDLVPISLPHTDTGPPFDPMPEDGAELLEQGGYVSTTYQSAGGDHGAGVSSVVLFESEAGARDWIAYETSDEAIRHQIPGAKIERFQVPDVPGAHGWTGPDQHGNAIGQVYWTQGRCMMVIGLEVEGPRVERLSAGVKAIYERTGGTCPD